MAIENPIIIVGAGVVGLTIAQALKKHGIPFLIFERDASPAARGQGWGITIHWALPALEKTLPQELVDRLPTIQVDPQQGRRDTGRFLFLNAATCEIKFEIPPNRRIRINREKFRRLLMTDIDVHWSKRLRSYTISPDGVTVAFHDGTTYSGDLIIGADGSSSTVRRLLLPSAYKLNQLPIRFTGVSVQFTGDQIAPLRALDPLLFQGTHPETGNYFWYSTLETPEANGTKDTYVCQLNMSWPVVDPDDEVKKTNEERLLNMKKRATDFAPVLRTAIDDIPDQTEVIEINLADWPCLPWQNSEGRITLVGDAAHAMTMYRGEAANHGLLDAANLVEALLSVHNNDVPLSSAVTAFEEEMRLRTSTAVLLSRQACIDAHDWSRLNENSPVLAKRAVSLGKT